MRCSRYWFIGVLVLALLLAGGYAFYDHFLKLSYATTTFYPNTGIVRDETDAKDGRFPARDGYIVLEISRGKHGHSLLTGNHGWRETIAIECPLPQTGTRFDVGRLGVQAYLSAHFNGRIQWNFGDNGLRGYIEFEEVTERRITARYAIIVDGHCASNSPGNQQREIVFEGRSMFRRQPAPEGKRFGDLWPRPSPTPTTK